MGVKIPLTAGIAETFVLILMHHVTVAIVSYLSLINIGAAVIILARALVAKLKPVGVKVETAPVANVCISVSRAKDSAMTKGNICPCGAKTTDLTFPASQ